MPPFYKAFNPFNRISSTEASPFWANYKKVRSAPAYLKEVGS